MPLHFSCIKNPDLMSLEKLHVSYLFLLLLCINRFFVIYEELDDFGPVYF